jgi:predicted DNA-binding protein with PD1-like motif
MRYHHFGGGRYVVRLDAGEDLVASLKAFAAERGVTAGYVTGFGSLDLLVLGFLDPATNEYVKRRFDERLEVGTLSGSLSMDGDRHHLHLHAVVSPRELIAYTGHVHEAKVGAVVEAFAWAFPGRLDRKTVEGVPFPALVLPGEAPLEGESPAR